MIEMQPFMIKFMEETMKLNKMPLIPLVLLAGMLYIGLTPIHAADEFPSRKKYPSVTPISTQDLYNSYKAGDTVVVDVRSKLEYDVIHINGASHIPLSNKTFLKDPFVYSRIAPWPTLRHREILWTDDYSNLFGVVAH